MFEQKDAGRSLRDLLCKCVVAGWEGSQGPPHERLSRRSKHNGLVRTAAWVHCATYGSSVVCSNVQRERCATRVSCTATTCCMTRSAEVAVSSDHAARLQARAALELHLLHFVDTDLNHCWRTLSAVCRWFIWRFRRPGPTVATQDVLTFLLGVVSAVCRCFICRRIRALGPQLPCRTS